jgi:hypothetical protein
MEAEVRPNVGSSRKRITNKGELGRQNKTDLGGKLKD